MTEEDYIAELLQAFAVPTSEKRAASINGDDAFLMSEDRVISTDMLIEGTHFLNTHPTDWLAYKAVSANISDMAAMGATPEAFLLSLALPSQQWQSSWSDFIAGLKEAADDYQLQLVGGDTVVSRNQLVISITMWGKTSHPVDRRGAQCGDLLMVYGPLGHSRLGWERWEKLQSSHNLSKWPSSESLSVDPFIKTHLKPKAWVAAGRFAAQHEAHAMMDISDGLWLDLPKLTLPSGCALVMDIESLPVDASLAHETPTNYRQYQLLGGEDYALAACVSAGQESTFRHEGWSTLGQIEKTRVQTECNVIWLDKGRQFVPTETPFTHFES